jgi:excinuclease ABC subunit A
MCDVQKLLEVLHRLVDDGATVIVIEHNLDVIKNADWIVDMGPEGGNGGGRVVAEGTPEEVAELEDSHTGRFLAPILARSARTPSRATGKRVTRQAAAVGSSTAKKVTEKQTTRTAAKKAASKKTAAAATPRKTATKKTATRKP